MTDPAVNPSIIDRIAREHGEQLADYARFAAAIERTITELLSETPLKVDAVTARAKTTSSLRHKVARKGYTELKQLTDLCGARIICYFESEIDDIARLLNREFFVVEDSKHGGAQPDTFGYVSRHLLLRLSPGRLSLPEWSRFETFVAEIQIRTVLQHAWAAISHSLAYKTADEIPVPTRRRLSRVAALLETGDEIFDVYRDEVDLLRRSYHDAAIGDTWTQLPLDLDSVIACWRHLELRELAEAAVSSGWREPSFADLYNSAERPIGNMDRASRLTRVAIASGISSISELLDDSRSVRVDDMWLASLPQNSTEYVPFAIGPDILGLSLVSRFGESVRHVAVEGRYPYLEFLVEVAERCFRTI